MHWRRIVFIAITSLFLAGCASEEYYKDCAAESAREFLFSKIKYMSPENEAFIKYTYPKMLVSNISSTYYFSQICFAWDLPSPKITILVYGASRNDLRGWFPVRVIFKKYTKEEMSTQHETTLERPGQLMKEEWKEMEREHS